MIAQPEATAELGIDGDNAVALLGPDLVEGVAVFVPVRQLPGQTSEQAEERAAFEALRQLQAKVGRPLSARWVGHWPRAEMDGKWVS